MALKATELALGLLLLAAAPASADVIQVAVSGPIIAGYDAPGLQYFQGRPFIGAILLEVFEFDTSLGTVSGSSGEVQVTGGSGINAAYGSLPIEYAHASMVSAFGPSPNTTVDFFGSLGNDLATFGVVAPHTLFAQYSSLAGREVDTIPGPVEQTIATTITASAIPFELNINKYLLALFNAPIGDLTGTANASWQYDACGQPNPCPIESYVTANITSASVTNFSKAPVFVPEPSSSWIVMGGMLALGWAFRKKVSRA
jgi:hypothetical protein